MLYFNSIKVQLKLRMKLRNVLQSVHFNSIKVQLKLHVKKKQKGNIEFQFHKGTIKTR